MELQSNYKNVICVYKITCLINNKILIGSTTNLYNRVCHYRTDINKPNPLKHYNRFLYNDILLYGLNNFKIEIIEQYDNISYIELKNKETYYMNLYNALNNNVGYNIRQDINGHYVCANSTRELKSEQTKEQWRCGIRANHSNKLKSYWNNVDVSRKIEQSKRMSKNKTKWTYNVYNRDTGEIIKENVLYKDINIPGYTNPQITERFCRANKKPITKKVIELYGDDIDEYRNTIFVDKYRIRRTKI